MPLARWILVSKTKITWHLLPAGTQYPSSRALPAGSWVRRAPELKSSLLTRPLVLALESSALSSTLESSDEGMMARDPLRVRSTVRRLADSPGPSALREGAGDHEVMHALDEMLGCFSALATAVSLPALSIGVEQRKIDCLLTPSAAEGGSMWGDVADRLILLGQAFKLAGLSRGLAIHSELETANGAWPVDGTLYARDHVQARGVGTSA